MAIQLDHTSNDISAKSGGDVTLNGVDVTSLAGPSVVEFVVVSGTSHTITGTDLGKVILTTSGSAVTITLPQTSTETIASGFNCGVIQRGSGAITFVAEGSDTIESLDSYTTTAGPGSNVYVLKLVEGTPNTYGIYGSLTS